MKDVVNNVRYTLGLGIELGITLVALAVLVQILFGEQAFFGGSVVTNIIALVSELGSQGIVGLFAFGVLLYVFNKRAASQGNCA
ncbi:MAG: hypothetical protein QF785_06170 [Phycisphaeraceae bacterium]|jgi:hypothetical protein|nr:hypothetical protein [Phycisphaeraceae bacterium]